MKSTSRMTKALLGGLVLLLIFALAGHAAAQTWTQLSPTGGPPTPRDESTSVYDPTTNSMIVFGGATGQPFGPSRPTLNDVWVLSNVEGSSGTPNWTQLTPTGGPPTARGVHTAVYDPTSNRMIMLGGNPAIGFCVSALSDIWVLTNANGQGGPPSWIQLSPVGGSPQQRMWASAVYDSANNRMIVFGGASTACGFPGSLAIGVWVLSNANGLGGTPTWTQISTTGSALDRIIHTAVYDPTNNRMIVFGGSAAIAGQGNAVWVLSNANGLGGTPTWTQLTPGGAVTPVRDFHSAVYDPREPTR